MGKHKGLQKYTTNSFYLTIRVLSELWLNVDEVQMALISAELGWCSIQQNRILAKCLKVMIGIYANFLVRILMNS
jgi:hypothetical protein